MKAAKIKNVFKYFSLILVLAIAALFLLGYASDIPLDELREQYANEESEFVDLGGEFIVHLRDEGPADAPAIILLHGSNASLHTWDKWTEKLKTQYRVIRFDQAGHGLTGPHPDDCYTRECYVDAVLRVAENRDLDKFILAGNSMGGNISYVFARQFPQKLNAIVLLDPSGAPQRADKQLPIGFRLAQTPVLNRLIGYITPRSIIESSLSQSVSKQDVVTPENIDLYWNMTRRIGNRRATRLRFEEYGQRKQLKPMQNLTVPALIIWGEEDKLINAKDAPWFAQQFSNSETKIYKDVGHLPMEEIANQSANDMATWLTTATAQSEP